LNRVPTASSPCPGGPTDTTTEPPFMTMTTNQSPVTTEGQQPMTTSGATLTTAWFGTNPARTAIHSYASMSFLRQEPRALFCQFHAGHEQ
jgi:hypothetical protein